MIPDHPLPPVTRRPRTTAPIDAPLDPAVVRYVGACEKILWSHTGAPVRDWLHQRGFNDDLLRANHVGADPGRTMLPRLRGLPHGHSIAATFPALGPAGDIAYVQARYLNPVGSDKYDNPAGRLGANPRLAWTQTPDGHTAPGLLLVTEGIPDALTAAAAGYASVGVLGSQAPDTRVAGVLARHSHDTGRALVAIVDADPAGRAWGERLGEMLGERDVSLSVVEPPVGLDLNAWATITPGWSANLSTDSLPDVPIGRFVS